MLDAQADISAAIAQALKTHTQKQLAAVFDVVPRTIARWESGKTPIPKAARALLWSLVQGPGPEKADTASGDFTFIDLFAGIGGIRKGFESIGGHCVFTSEWDTYCQKSYALNFPADGHKIWGDITKAEPDVDVPSHDVLLAGFPCQPFSIAGVSKKNALGRPHGFECTTQGTLFFDVARIIAAKRPAAFLLENVKNLVSHDKGNTLRVILETLRSELGYHVEWKVVDGQHFVPQHRERIIIVGFREDVGFSWERFTLPSLDSAPRMGDILHKEDGTESDIDEGRFLDSAGKVQRKYVLSNKLWQYLKAYKAKHEAKGNGFGFGLVTPDDVARTLSARYFKDGSEILVDRGRGNPRRLTPRECARLMGFSDDFKINVSDTRAYKQFGNSVVVPVIAHVARHMQPYIASAVQASRDSALQRQLF